LTKRTNAPRDFKGTAQRVENRPWHITAKREVGKTIAHYGLKNPAFVPTLEEILDNLRANPYQYATKEGPLADLRGADLHFEGQKYRLLYQIFKEQHVVRLVVLDARKSNTVYRKAKRVKGGQLDSDMKIG
jgi:mRNA-degrading endonuclease RelE of RelBE toxin-antitoxin system